MRLIFDAKPVKTFALQLNMGIGWRHEPVKSKGKIRKSLEETVNSLKFFLPSWFETFYILDAEHSSIVVLGLSEDQEKLLKAVEIVEREFPEAVEELGGGMEMGVLSGGIRKSTAMQLRSFEFSQRTRKTVLVSPPKRFLALKELSRAQKHFLVFICTRRNCELYLEISRRNDRVQYGLHLREVKIESLKDEFMTYKAWLLRRSESTKESASILSIMNVFSENYPDIPSIIEDVEKINLAHVAEVFKTITEIAKRLNQQT